MKKQAALFLMVFFGTTSFLASCSVATFIVLYNHSGQDLVIVADEKTYQVAKDSILTLQYPQHAAMSISGDNAVWEYTAMYIQREYAKEYIQRGFLRYEVNFQVEPNGLIYIVKPEVTRPVREFPPQPPGFPLTPKGP